MTSIFTRAASLCRPLSLSGSVTSRANETLVLKRVMDSVRERGSRTNDDPAPVPRCHGAIAAQQQGVRLSAEETFFSVCRAPQSELRKPDSEQVRVAAERAVCGARKSLTRQAKCTICAHTGRRRVPPK